MEETDVSLKWLEMNYIGLRSEWDEKEIYSTIDSCLDHLTNLDHLNLPEDFKWDKATSFTILIETMRDLNGTFLREKN